MLSEEQEIYIPRIAPGGITGYMDDHNDSVVNSNLWTSFFSGSQTGSSVTEGAAGLQILCRLPTTVCIDGIYTKLSLPVKATFQSHVVTVASSFFNIAGEWWGLYLMNEAPVVTGVPGSDDHLGMQNGYELRCYFGRAVTEVWRATNGSYSLIKSWAGGALGAFAMYNLDSSFFMFDGGDGLGLFKDTSPPAGLSNGYLAVVLRTDTLPGTIYTQSHGTTFLQHRGRQFSLVS